MKIVLQFSRHTYKVQMSTLLFVIFHRPCCSFVRNTLFEGPVKITQTKVQLVKYSCSVFHLLHIIPRSITNENYIACN
jgi:hypothetical protein